MMHLARQHEVGGNVISQLFRIESAEVTETNVKAMLAFRSFGLVGSLLFFYAMMMATLGFADQTNAKLPSLFDSLKSASTAVEARNMESQIWQFWLEAPDESSHLLMSQITSAMSSGQLKIALNLSNQLIDGTPKYSEAWNKRATIHYLMGDDDASVADIRETLSLEPRHFGAISGLGLIFMRQGNLEAALDAFEQVLIISPASDSAKLSVERVKQEMGREI